MLNRGTEPARIGSRKPSWPIRPLTLLACFTLICVSTGCDVLTSNDEMVAVEAALPNEELAIPNGSIPSLPEENENELVSLNCGDIENLDVPPPTPPVEDVILSTKLVPTPAAPASSQNQP